MYPAAWFIAMISCHIEWLEENAQETLADFEKIDRSNILQSLPYARANCTHMGQKTRLGLIYIGDQKAGLVRIYEAGFLWNAIHAVILDRGPLWFDGFGGAAHVKAFFEEFNHLFPRRFGRRRRIIPEIEDGPAIQKILSGCGFERMTRPAYQTIWLDLQKDDEALKADMRKNWRGSLNKAERSELEIIWDKSGQYLPWMMKCYSADKGTRGYSGANPVFLRKIASSYALDQSCMIGVAQKEGRKIAAIMVFKHGKSATYQCGWTSPLGRDNNANHLLLWSAVRMLRDDGIQDFDLGGVNDETAKGVKSFKEGLGGKTICLVGHYM